jgi:hypothetical protein
MGIALMELSDNISGICGEKTKANDENKSTGDISEGWKKPVSGHSRRKTERGESRRERKNTE